MNARGSHKRRLLATKEKLEKTNEKLLKLIKFELEVQKNLAAHISELHKQRLRDLQVCLT